ncbi:hypothetical protein Y032_0011g1242 [Ancylostoma ceylanicum]|uniref:Uncharacterized protein n=1 Tax=Ancylostoma ceylanicum TaxID=53326 RepID=A0A016VFJ1_9BILA|nr:hypothetical protein Y032_0011g1242 [Ancylostoma ceylanicum]
MEWIGLFAAVFASVLFGSVFVPIKRVAAGDGFTAQLFMCIGAFMAAAVVHASLYFPPVYGFAMISGTLWCTANAFAIQIINRLGLALSVLVWNTVSCLTGWATSRYGLFGLPPAIPASTVLNYLGIIGLIAGYFSLLNHSSEKATAPLNMHSNADKYSHQFSAYECCFEINMFATACTTIHARST